MNELIITGKEKEVKICVTVNECKITFANLTKYKKPPFFEIMRADISEADRQKARQDWLHSIPPSLRALITNKIN